jgi:hypothetical protein
LANRRDLATSPLMLAWMIIASVTSTPGLCSSCYRRNRYCCFYYGYFQRLLSW